MRERFAQGVLVSALFMAVTLSSQARAQTETERARGEQKSTAPMSETIQGIVSGVTAEGEVFYNHQTHSATKAEAAFLTVIGSPIHSEAGERDRREKAAGNERHARRSGKRHNVYIVWLTPKTKVCEASGDSGTAQNAPKEVTIDKLEVGDHVEVQFARHEDSAAHHDVHQTRQMREKHGRHRTHVGYATSITIMPSKEHEQSSTGTGAKSNESSK